jgi:hypothetical protein
MKEKLAIVSAGVTTVLGTCLSMMIISEARAATFTFRPKITFEVIDGIYGGAFDGQGDLLFPGNFDTVVKGTVGEISEHAEFSLSELSVPPQEVITSAIFQVQIFSLLVTGVGVRVGENPSALTVRGYVGDGRPDASDFQNGTIVDTVELLSPFIGQKLQFDVTSFIQSLASRGDSFAGFTVRAKDFGGLALARPPAVSLTVTTMRTTAPVPEPFSASGALLLLGAGVARKYSRKSASNHKS